MKQILLLLLWVLPACGMSIQPVTPDGRPHPDATVPESFDPAVAISQSGESAPNRRICRTSSRPRGWIAIDYEQDAGSCPKPVHPENPFTVALITRYSDFAVGSTLVVCADQGVPRGWIRLNEAVESERCTGARVSDGSPTVYVMRRTR